jgi:hypothetical protein
VTSGNNFCRGWDISSTCSNVQYIADVNSKFHETAIFNTGGAVLRSTIRSSCPGTIPEAARS